MRSVTEQLDREREHNGVDPLPGDPHQLADLLDSTMPAPTDSAHFNETAREKQASAKLKLAFATRGVVPKATGVGFVTPGRDQRQEIFDDGSVRNPYKVNHNVSGRQRKRMRKLANRTMKARGVPGRIEDVLKGRKSRPQPETPQSPAPVDDPHEVVGMPVAAILGD